VDVVEKPRKWKFPCLAVAGLMVAALVSHGTAGTEGPSGPRQLLDALTAAVNGRSLEEIHSLYSLPGAAEVQQTRASYEELFESYGDLKYSQRITHTREAADRTDIVVLREIEYQKAGRPYLSASWVRVAARATPRGWRIVAEDQMAHARPASTDLKVEIDPEGGLMKAEARISLKELAEGVDALIFSLNRGLEIESIEDEQGSDVAFTRTGQTVIVSLEQLRPGKTLPALRFAYQGGLFNETAELGYSNVNIGLEGSYASWLSAWYPQVMGEDSGSPGSVTFQVPAGLTVASNGRLVGHHERDGHAEFTFEISRPLTYSFAAADYFHKSKLVDGVEVGVYLLRPDEEKADLYIDRAGRLLRFFKEEVYGMYPYATYWIVEMPARVAGRTGGSAEQGLSLFPDISLAPNYFNDAVIAHEMGHSWWGTWVIGEGVLMSEGLAQLSFALAMEHLYGEEIMRRFVKHGTEDYFQAAYNYFSSIADRPGADWKLGINRWDKLMELHRLSNTKAHAVFLVLRDEIGRQAFYEGMRRALEKYAGTRMTLEQLQQEWEAASGRDLDWFFDQWFQRIGAPELRLETEVARRDGKYEVSGKISQAGRPYRCSVEVLVEGAGGAERSMIAVDGKAIAFDLTVPFEPERILLDPDYKLPRWTDEFRTLKGFGDGFEKVFAGEFEEGAALMASYVKAHPDDMMARTWLGSTLYRFLRRPDEALEQFSYVMENADPAGEYELYASTAAMYAGNIHDARNEREKAVACYEHILARDRTKRYERRARSYLERPFRPLPPPPPLAPPPSEESAKPH
jgi:tetratricopeptide (TPR) repeat protein